MTWEGDCPKSKRDGHYAQRLCAKGERGGILIGYVCVWSLRVRDERQGGRTSDMPGCIAKGCTSVKVSGKWVCPSYAKMDVNE